MCFLGGMAGSREEKREEEGSILLAGRKYQGSCLCRMFERVLVSYDFPYDISADMVRERERFNIFCRKPDLGI